MRVTIRNDILSTKVEMNGGNLETKLEVIDYKNDTKPVEIIHVLETVAGVPAILACRHYTNIPFILHIGRRKDSRESIDVETLCRETLRSLSFSPHTIVGKYNRLSSGIFIYIVYSHHFNKKTYDPVLFEESEYLDVVPNKDLEVTDCDGTTSYGWIKSAKINNIGTVLSFTTVFGKKIKLMKTNLKRYMFNINGTQKTMSTWLTCDGTGDIDIELKCGRWRRLVYKLLNAARLRHKYRPSGVWFKRKLELDDDLDSSRPMPKRQCLTSF